MKPWLCSFLLAGAYFTCVQVDFVNVYFVWKPRFEVGGVGKTWGLKCNKCVKVFSMRSKLHQHHDVDHGRVKLADVQGEKYPCLRCHREFSTESIFVSHSRDHKENVYACNECLWHFNTIAGLIKHCQDTHDDRHFACTTCGEVFGSNPDLCRHTTSYHIKLCHICRRTFVSDNKLIDHVRESHPGATVCT